MSIRIGIVGLGKIVRDQHLPALSANADFNLVATADPHASPIGNVPHFNSLSAMLASDQAIDAVAICTPPQVRAGLALEAIKLRKSVMLEKPPASGLAQANMLRDAAAKADVSLFAAWHSREAAGVASARQWLAERTIISANVTWREDVHQWHPGQAWIWQAGGMGVFDPGINALSILTTILPEPVTLDGAELEIPANCHAPIAARLAMRGGTGCEITADFDFRQKGEQTWQIVVETDAGELRLDKGGAVLTLPEGGPVIAEDDEYPALYRHFSKLMRGSQQDCDLAPLALVADAFMLGKRTIVADFFEQETGRGPGKE